MYDLLNVPSKVTPILAKELKVGDWIILDFGYGAHSREYPAKITRICPVVGLWGDEAMMFDVNNGSEKMVSTFGINDTVELYQRI